MDLAEVEVIAKAARLAYEAHAGQFRKFMPGVPYIVHPQRVAAKTLLIPDAPYYVPAASWDHDVDEDCKEEFKRRLRIELPSEVVSLVEEVTNPSIKYPHLNRAQRKAMDREHLKSVSSWAKVIKFLDRIDNIGDMLRADKGFQEKYTAETMLLIEALLTGEDNELLTVLAKELRDAVTHMQTMAVRRSLSKIGG